LGEDGKIVYKVVINDDGVENDALSAGKKAGDGVEQGARGGTGAFHEMMTGAFRRIGAAAVDMAAKAANAFVDLTKQALDSVGSYEQNIGGVETLFKESADTVIANAKRAYETAGMSANEYMQNVTSFSASLLQSLGGDTAAAAEYADQAIIDMSDNANKMGTDIQSIQNAYQGFAKQNYTMLDNLKLGYGGTKEEMQRLIDDANKVKIANGEMADLTIDSFADVTEAIHIIQTEMGITGTTSAEAASTIEGSMASAKAAYDNFLNGSISAEEFAATVGTAAQNIVDNLAEIVTRFSTELPGLIEALGAQLPGLVQTVGPPLFNAVVALLGSLFNLLLSNIPGMINSGVELLLGLVNGLVQAIPELIPAIVQIITQIQTSLINHMPELIEAGLQLIVALGIGLVRAIPDLLAMTPQIITSLINAFSGADWSSIGHNIVAGIWNGISGLWGDLTSKVSNGVTNLWNSAKNALGISSPSKKFKYIGEMSVEGTEEGFEDREAEMTRVVHDVYSGISATAEDALRPTTMSENLERNVSYNLTASGSVDGTYIIVPLNIDGREVARATAWSMGQQLAWEEM
jgi:phage-related protein